MSKQNKLWAQPKSKWLLGIPVGAFFAVVIGAIGTMGFNTVMDATSTEEFCVGCHVPGFAAQEFHNSPHANNATGFKVACADCHIPDDFIGKMMRKIAALKEIYWHIQGDYNTYEGYSDHKKYLQANVIAHFQATDSKACRNCHDVALMDFSQQSKLAVRMHERMDDMGKTCIDCHKGRIAHERAR
ncbi:MAG: NapC/NirT family cytochrome c [Ferrimonas sp.]